MSVKRTLVEIAHDEGYGDALLKYININLRGKDMLAERIVTIEKNDPHHQKKPKKYRPFASAEEFKPHRNRWVTRKDKSDKEAQPGAFHVAAYDDVGYWCSGGVHERFDTAFSHGRCFDDDGTPFGIEVTE